jgi:N-methylhydantoinase B
MNALDAIEIEIVRHLFSSIAEEMGAALMRSAFSPNIKERRDYSCAIFDAQARMIAQAAHIPVHLGSTPMSVRAALDAFPDLAPGQHVLLNDPYAGGTHLPDLTLVTPVHDASGAPAFYVANRAHHADVGGISPGSLPLSTSIDDEGIRVPPTLWSPELEARIMAASRTPDERRGDLLAQLAANHRGAARLRDALSRRGESLLAASASLIDYAERVIRAVLADAPDGTWSFEDTLDGDGHDAADVRVHCVLTIAGDDLTVDLTGCADQVTGPVNVPRAVSVSAALYALRCLAPQGAPSNHGMMRPLTVLTRPGSIADAVYPAAVAAGNVETSQRLTDCILGALAQALPDRIPAASCGSMNNVLIGGADHRPGREGEPFAYYETIAGGAGAARGAHGASGAHTHMTNTLNTPAEALERAYPFRLARYALRDGSGGAGRWRGGDGVVRAYAFDAPATVTLMTERRATAPWGLSGGAPGAPGRNLLVRDGAESVLPAKCTVEVTAGDLVVIETPGGGGWGAQE